MSLMIAKTLLESFLDKASVNSNILYSKNMDLKSKKCYNNKKGETNSEVESETETKEEGVGILVFSMLILGVEILHAIYTT